MDRPVNMSVKDWLIRRISVDTAISESVIREVISHEFDTVIEKMRDVESIELSGFGKFYFKRRRAVLKLKKFEEIEWRLERELREDELNEFAIKSANRKLGIIKKEIEILKARVGDDEDKFIPGVRGMAKQAVSS